MSVGVPEMEKVPRYRVGISAAAGSGPYGTEDTDGDWQCIANTQKKAAVMRKQQRRSSSSLQVLAWKQEPTLTDKGMEVTV